MWVNRFTIVCNIRGYSSQVFPTPKSVVGIDYSDGKLPWVQRDRVDGPKRPWVKVLQPIPTDFGPLPTEFCRRYMSSFL